MLDATDSEAESTTVEVYRVHVRRVEEQKVGIDAWTCTTPRVTVRTRGDKRTGSSITVARSRIKSNHFIPYKTVLTFVGIDLYVFIKRRLIIFILLSI
jgi:hypothetical protein